MILNDSQWIVWDRILNDSQWIGWDGVRQYSQWFAMNRVLFMANRWEYCLTLMNSVILMWTLSDTQTCLNHLSIASYHMRVVTHTIHSRLITCLNRLSIASYHTLFTRCFPWSTVWVGCFDWSTLWIWWFDWITLWIGWFDYVTLWTEWHSRRVVRLNRPVSSV